MHCREALSDVPSWRWAILTGEYPPQPGGVSDYTRLVAEGLAVGGDEVHVWAPEVGEERGGGKKEERGGGGEGGGGGVFKKTTR